VELECSCSPYTNLWRIESWILNITNTRAPVQALVRCTYMQAETVLKPSFIFRGGWKRVDLSESRDRFLSPSQYLFYVKEDIWKNCVVQWGEYLDVIGNIYFIILSGVRVSPLGTAVTIWPIVPAPEDRWWWMWSSRWNANWQGKPKYSEKTCPSATLSTTNPTWPDAGSNPGRCAGKPATNRPSYGTVLIGSNRRIGSIITTLNLHFNISFVLPSTHRSYRSFFRFSAEISYSFHLFCECSNGITEDRRIICTQ
jgi:hypothetical protein